MNKYSVLSGLAFLMALGDSLAAMTGYWSVTNPQTRSYVQAFEAATLIVLVVNGYLIMRSVKTNATQFKMAILCFGALLLCVCGDVVNFNLTQQYYIGNNVIKHDYLIDSIWFFAPGYLLLICAIWPILSRLYSVKILIICLLLTIVFALACYLNMAMFSSGAYILGMSSLYSVIIAVPTTCAILLLFAIDIRQSPLNICVIALGLMMATVADAIIGILWLFGNDGVGYFPLARELNWIVYIASQSIVIHMPRVLNIEMIVPNIRHSAYIKRRMSAKI